MQSAQCRNQEQLGSIRCPASKIEFEVALDAPFPERWGALTLTRYILSCGATAKRSRCSNMSDQPARPRAAGQTSSRLGSQARPRIDLYETITQKVIEMLEAGVVPWRSGVLGLKAAGYPKNLCTGKPYRGVNVFLLAFMAYAKGYESAYWLTFQQANQRGGRVKRGEKSSLVVFWKPLETTDRQTGEVKKISVLRYYNVFNANQCEGVEVPDAPNYTPSEFAPIEAAETIVKEYSDGPKVVLGGAKAFYTPETDTVKLPEPTRFESTEQFYATMFHELSHSTGHSKRLDRGLDTKLAAFGSADYGREELVAEMSAAFLCGAARIDPAVIKNQAAYVSGWLGAIKKDKRLIIVAGGQAQRSADWVLGTRPGPHPVSVEAGDHFGGIPDDNGPEFPE